MPQIISVNQTAKKINFYPVLAQRSSKVQTTTDDRNSIQEARGQRTQNQSRRQAARKIIQDRVNAARASRDD